MAQKITDDQLTGYLRKISKAELITWLVERSEQDEGLRASLLDLAAPKEQARVLASEIKARIRQAWQIGNRRDGWKMALPIAQALDQVLVSIRSLIEKGCPVEAEKLLATFTAKAEKATAHIDDSYGHLWPTCQEGVTLWGQAWSRIEPRDTMHLVNLVYEHVHDNDYAVKDDMISKFAEALGEDGLHALQRRLRGDLAGLPTPHPDEPTWKQDLRQTEIISWLKEIADCLGDVDEYIMIAEAHDRVEIEAIPIARRLLEAGRAQEALAFLDKSTSGPRFVHGEPHDGPTLKKKILLALGQTQEARDILWGEFSASLSEFTFREVLDLTDDSQKRETLEKAIAVAEQYRSPEQGAYFLVQMNELARASRVIEQRQDEISGSLYTMVLKIAQSLAEPYPLQAWLLYRSLLMDILENGRYNAYGHGARYLKTMEYLATKAEFEDRQSEFVQRLREKHGRKRSFWAKLDPR